MSNECRRPFHYWLLTIDYCPLTIAYHSSLPGDSFSGFVYFCLSKQCTIWVLQQRPILMFNQLFNADSLRSLIRLIALLIMLFVLVNVLQWGWWIVKDGNRLKRLSQKEFYSYFVLPITFSHNSGILLIQTNSFFFESASSTGDPKYLRPPSRSPGTPLWA